MFAACFFWWWSTLQLFRFLVCALAGGRRRRRWRRRGRGAVGGRGRRWWWRGEEEEGFGGGRGAARRVCAQERELVYFLPCKRICSFVVAMSLRCRCERICHLTHASACVTSLMRAHLSPHSFERQSARALLTCQEWRWEWGLQEELLQDAKMITGCQNASSSFCFNFVSYTAPHDIGATGPIPRVSVF